MFEREIMILLWTLVVVLVVAAVLQFVGQKRRDSFLMAMAISLIALATAVLAALYGFHQRYWSAAVFGVLAFTQGMSARRKWLSR